MKTSTNVNQGKKQNVCVAFCLNNHSVSYVKSTDYILTLKKLDPAQMRHINAFYFVLAGSHTTLVSIIFVLFSAFQPIAKTIVMMQVKKLFLVNQTYYKTTILSNFRIFSMAYLWAILL